MEASVIIKLRQKIEQPSLCGCGCGEEVTWNERNKCWNTYVNWHCFKNRSDKRYNNYIDGRTEKLKQWIFDVKQRDNYICQICGKKQLEGINCIAHYIKSKNEFPELIYDVDNGQTLCDSCHNSITNKDRIRSQETIEKIRNSLLGNIPWMKDKHHTEISRKKISEAQVGKIQSKETCEKRSNALQGRVFSEESIQKMRKPKSEEAKKNMRIAQKLAWIKRKNINLEGEIACT
jgi:5-methylcytosine-specific restriction endonuclease McrA